jgi:hypothetical protein
MKKYAGKIMRWTLVSLAGLCLGIICILPCRQVEAALTVASSSVTDWTHVAAEATGESSVIDLSGNYVTAIHIQAFLDSTTAHEGTEFIVQVSANSSDDEDWTDFSVFKALVGTADSLTISDNPLSPASTTISTSDTGGGYETEPMGKWVAIEDSTLANSELVWLTGYTTDTNITIQDGTKNSHVQSTLMYDIAVSKTVIVPMGAGSRARVIVNNGVDMDATASSLNYRVLKTVTTVL